MGGMLDKPSVEKRTDHGTGRRGEQFGIRRSCHPERLQS